MTLQATFCATLVDEWARGGVRSAVISPGSRSAPLTIAILADRRITAYFRLDERSAAFFALGIALESDAPVVVVTTSGTAASEVHAAVIEADLARVPLIVATTDRPYELHGVGAPQTITQPGLYGTAVRFSADPGVPDVAAIGSWRSFASRLTVEARGSLRGPGPVHVNLPFRDPLVGSPDELPPGRPGGRPWHEVIVDRAPGRATVERFVDALAGRRGVIVIGGPIGGDGEVVVDLARRLGWPIFADPRTMARGTDPVLVAHPDGVCRSRAARDALVPEVVLHLGAPHASKVLTTWWEEIAASGVPQILVDPYGAFEDPERSAALVVRTDAMALCRAAADSAKIDKVAEGEWLSRWREVDDAAAAAISEAVGGDGSITEPGVARAVFAAAGPDWRLFASSSMPVRDLEWFGSPRDEPPVVYANRGANGIDGVSSTVLGVAAAAGPGHKTVAIVGDLAFLYDLSGLVFGTHEEIPNATFVVVDNRGGGIFSFLPYPEVLDDVTFDRAFGTPQRPEIASVVRGLGHDVVEIDSLDDLSALLGEERQGITVLVARTDRTENVAFHDFVERTVAAAVDEVVAGF